MAALRRYAGLLQERDFRRLWLAQTVSQVGTQVTNLALPLVAILILQASAFEVALLGAIEFLPFVFFTLPAGAWVDRLPKRRVLITADLGRAAILALVPIGYLTGVLAMWQLYVIGFSAGILTVFFEVAYQSILPELVDRDRLAEGNSRLEISRSAAQILGPGIGGFLVGVITAPMAILADALSYLGSAGFLFGIRATWRAGTSAGTKDAAGPNVAAVPNVAAAPNVAAGMKEAPRAPSLRHEIAEGLRFYAKSSLLLAESAAIVTMNLGSNISYSILLVFLVRELRLRPEAIGVAFSIGSIGVLAGAASAAAFGRRLGVGPALIVATAIVTGGAFLIVLATPETAFVLLLAMAAIQGFSGIIINVNGVSLRQSLTPDHLQGRVNATGRWINWSILPLAAVLGGLIATAIGLRGTILVGAVIGLLSLPWLIFTPIRRLREMPSSPIGVAPPDIVVTPPSATGQPPA